MDHVYLDIVGHMFVDGDHELVAHGAFTFAGAQGLLFTAANANNHQLTYGVLAEAVEALTSYMRGAGFGRALFTIFDGANAVGSGRIK